MGWLVVEIVRPQRRRAGFDSKYLRIWDLALDWDPAQWSGMAVGPLSLPGLQKK